LSSTVSLEPRKGFFCEGAVNYAVKQSSHHILNEDEDRRQRFIEGAVPVKSAG
jgi:hypothetical protein